MAAELRRQLDALCEEILARGAVDAETVELLSAPLCRATRLVVGPNAHTKMDEIIFASSSSTKLTVSKHPNGPDLLDAVAGEHHELKTSVCRARGGRCNISWALPPSTLAPAARRERLLATVRRKVSEHGCAVFHITDGLGRELVTYRFSRQFLLAYFSELRISPNARSHNFGCQRCVDCGRFHRLDKIDHFAKQFAAANTKGVDWKAVFSPTSTRCFVATKE
jgi:hypothetical protein